MNVKFGLDSRHHRTGTDLAVCVMQLAAFLPLIYLVLASAWPSILVRRSLLSRMFDLGVSAIPRAVSLSLSALYRATGREVLFSLLLAALALCFGVAMKQILQGEHARTARIILAALIALDLLARLLPLRFAALFGMPVTILAFVLRAVCLALVILDLIKAKKTEQV